MSALVSLGGGRLLVLERSGSPGLPPFDSRIYLVDTSRGLDVSAIERDLAGLREKLLDKLLALERLAGLERRGAVPRTRLADGGMALVGIADNGGLAARPSWSHFPSSPPPPTDAALIGAAAALVAVALVVGRSPAHDHVRLDHLAGAVEVVAGLVHVEPDGVDLVAGGLGEALPGRVAGIGRESVSPRADFEITHLSRGRRVSRTIFSPG